MKAVVHDFARRGPSGFIRYKPRGAGWESSGSRPASRGFCVFAYLHMQRFAEPNFDCLHHLYSHTTIMTKGYAAAAAAGDTAPSQYGNSRYDTI
jgi:hypothetical protein